MKYFISGHRKLTIEEFKDLYIPEIKKAVENDPDPIFLVAECEGADRMAQDYLSDILNEEDLWRITVYHMYSSPRYISIPGILTKGGYKSDVERDAAMTADSDIDIAFIRKGQWTSGTAQNILRRRELL